MLNFGKSPDGLLPAIVQDYQTKDVLMLAYINESSWRKTIETGKAHYSSRSRNKLWLKGESSGHVQIIHDILVDCLPHRPSELFLPPAAGRRAGCRRREGF